MSVERKLKKFEIAQGIYNILIIKRFIFLLFFHKIFILFLSL